MQGNYAAIVCVGGRGGPPLRRSEWSELQRQCQTCVMKVMKPKVVSCVSS